MRFRIRNFSFTYDENWAVVVAQLTRVASDIRGPGSLPISEDPGSNPIIGNFFEHTYLLLSVCRKDENIGKNMTFQPKFR